MVAPSQEVTSFNSNSQIGKPASQPASEPSARQAWTGVFCHDMCTFASILSRFKQSHLYIYTCCANVTPRRCPPRVLHQTWIHHPFTDTTTFTSDTLTSVTGPITVPLSGLHSLAVSVPSCPHILWSGTLYAVQPPRVRNQLSHAITGSGLCGIIAGSFVGFLKCSALRPEVPCLRHRLPC